jgi:hypothetical protein
MKLKKQPRPLVAGAAVQVPGKNRQHHTSPTCPAPQALLRVTRVAVTLGFPNQCMKRMKRWRRSLR